MPVTHEQVVKALKSVCRKLDYQKRKNRTTLIDVSSKALTSYQFLKTFSYFEKLTGYMTHEINEWTERYDDLYQITPKQQVVGTLIHFFKPPAAGLDRHPRLMPFIEAIADYLGDSKLEEERRRPRPSPLDGIEAEYRKKWPKAMQWGERSRKK